MQENRTTIIASIIGVLLLIVLTITGSYAYYTISLKITGESNSTTKATTADLKLNFTDGPVLDIKNLVPGGHVSKTFTVTNTGNTTIKYQISVKEVANGFERPQDLKVEIKEDGKTIKNDGTFPTTAGALSGVLSIEPGEAKKHQYEIIITYYNEPLINQKNDMDKTVSAEIFIEGAQQQ